METDTVAAGARQAAEPAGVRDAEDQRPTAWLPMSPALGPNLEEAALLVAASLAAAGAARSALRRARDVMQDTDLEAAPCVEFGCDSTEYAVLEQGLEQLGEVSAMLAALLRRMRVLGGQVESTGGGGAQASMLAGEGAAREWALAIGVPFAEGVRDS